MARLPNFLVIIRSEKLSGKGQGRGCLGVRKKERFVLGKRTFRSQKSKHFVLRIIYLSFVRFNDGNNVWIAELEKDLITLKKETMRPCIHVSQAWEEVWPRVNEGSYILKHNGIYYMTYSANSYESPFYGVGCATATDIMGEWAKYDENPLLQNPGGLVGVGHSAMFTDKEGKLRIVFHAHKDKSNIHPRAMYIGTVNFENVNGTDRMRISKEYITPKLLQ